MAARIAARVILGLLAAGLLYLAAVTQVTLANPWPLHGPEHSVLVVCGLVVGMAVCVVAAFFVLISTAFGGNK